MTALVVAAGALTGGFVSGLAGFGTGLIALGFWLHVVDPPTAATLVAICSVVSQVQSIGTIWHAIDWRRSAPMLLAGLLGVPIGTYLLDDLPARTFRIGLGLFLLGFSAFMLLWRREHRMSWGGRPADAAVGLAGGLMGGLTGLSGPLPTVWATLRGWDKHARRGMFQAFNLLILGAALAWHAAAGLLTAEIGRLTLMALPGTLAGSWLGVRLYRRLSTHHFHRVVLGLLGLSGLIILWSSV
ncbi:MAG TPA: sulfite exporter TauE/SafE family protein [Rhodopila sp.]|uniref:sulfite exporter TauE/SafE family protein n=1 Tax=Rhodopila sp. TaxID=2480087 RepID=UPI002C41A5C1|nr:sulfite exporter TauE/SafE family protein [Rhodopila sp.]HVY16975.1 sulfite exporter TauE/SafE family protein [Rhodopila sp.]